MAQNFTGNGRTGGATGRFLSAPTSDGRSICSVRGNNVGATSVGRTTAPGGDDAGMAITDYDAPRRPVVELEDDSLDELKARRAGAQSPTVDVEEPDGDFELPGADLSDEELTVSVVPMRADEFRCDSCFLVHHRSQLVVHSSGRRLCRDCA
jgi:hypothetical protein